MFQEPLIRNRYSEPPFTEGDFSARHFDEDLNEYHLPLSRIQFSNLHGHGIIQGLDIQGDIGTSNLRIESGLAVDQKGQLIVLSTEGQADIGNNPAAEEHQEIDVPVVLDLSRVTEAETTINYYVTIQFSEILRFEEGPLGRYDHAPWIRLQPKEGDEAYVDDGLSIVLAEVKINTEGILEEVLTTSRKLASQMTGGIELNRIEQTDQTIKQVPAGKILANENGELQITVPQTENTISFSQSDGNNLSRMDLKVDDIRLGETVKITETVEIQAAMTTEQLSTTSLQAESLSVSSDTELGGSLKIAGNLEVQGNVIAKDTEHIAGNVTLGDQDEDEVKITGSVRSGHSSGALTIDDAMRITNDVLVDQRIGIGTTPNRPLTIQGTGSASEWVTFKDNAGSTKWHLNMSGNGFNFVESGIADYRLFIQQGGNVGVGTSSPRSKFDVRGTLTADKITGEGAVLRNMIMMWSGDIRRIPKGWSLCDGSNGTPNLRDRFILGADVGQNHQTGGSRTHSHTTSDGSNRTRNAIVDVAAAGKRRDNYSDEIHTHSVSTSEHLPPFYRLAFIMKL